MSRYYRARTHDYQAPSSYHITLFKDEACPLFSSIHGDLRKNPHADITLTYSDCGISIARSLRRIPILSHDIYLQQYIIMPDHIHLLLSVIRELPQPLGYYIRSLKRIGNELAGRTLYGESFHDRIILPEKLSEEEKRVMNLMSEDERKKDWERRMNAARDLVKAYIKDNPRRLLIRRQFPERFSRVECLTIAGRQYQVYGNLLLLNNPFKLPVIVHRRDDERTRTNHREKWLHTAANGGVLVSPFISPAEKQIRREAEELAGKLILIRNEPFAERGKPMGHDFELCEQGRMLILHPLALPKDITQRAQCLYMNARAEDICAERRPRF